MTFESVCCTEGEVEARASVVESVEGDSTAACIGTFARADGAAECGRVTAN